jgi:pre-mRNA-processing factor SLU7
VELKKEGGGESILNLKIKKDTAKYLRNICPNSAPYDPKSRFMKENPNL